MSSETVRAESAPLAGERIAIVGELASMSRREASELVAKHGGEVAKAIGDSVTLVLVGDENADARVRLRESGHDDLPLVRETELWQRLGLVDAAAGVSRFYTPAMLAELIGAPTAAVRRWWRRGYLQPSREVGRLPYFAIGEVQVARNLATLLGEGCSLARIDKLVAQLDDFASDTPRPLADLAVVVREGKLFIRQGDDLAEPTGQRLLDFDAPTQDQTTDDDFAASASSSSSIPLSTERSHALEPSNALFDPDEARAAAIDSLTAGDLPAAIAACRAALMADGDAEDHFLLAEMLYQSGDLPAARERYYVVLELDESHVEARANLGCILAELGDLPLAAASLRGALSQQPDFADAHYHLARTLDALGERVEAEGHWRAFLEIAPASPWAEEAHERLQMSTT